MSVFTVGTAEAYDEGIRTRGDEFKKLGRRENYPGGFACNSIDDAKRLIDTFGKRGVWAVYELNAEWDRDTVKSKHGWWHALINDSIILRKVPNEMNDQYPSTDC